MKKLSFFKILLPISIAGLMFTGCESQKESTEQTTEIIVETETLVETETEEKEVYVFTSDDPKVIDAQKSGVPTVVLSDYEGKPGDRIEVPVILVNNPGILGMSMTLSYDEDILTLVDAQIGDAVGEILELSHTQELSSGCNFLWDGEFITEEDTRDGAILFLTFEVSKEAGNAKTPIVMILDKEGAFNNDLGVVDLSAENGYVVITE